MTHETFQPIHDLYCKLTNRFIPCTTQMHFTWHYWTNQGFTEADLKLVVALIQKRIKENRRRSESLRFQNLIGDTERFHEDLAEARALARIHRPEPGRAAVLRASGRTEPVKDNVRTAAEIAASVLAGAEALRKFKELGKNL